ncbi:hypothetical protein B0H14DRAFT_2728308 [Mycena olivaceomarginata]|nr:hypothetical protein B0H14DRAFT_2728308 [Mycena olivaceomarginata]
MLWKRTSLVTCPPRYARPRCAPTRRGGTHRLRPGKGLVANCAFLQTRSPRRGGRMTRGRRHPAQGAKGFERPTPPFTRTAPLCIPPTVRPRCPLSSRATVWVFLSISTCFPVYLRRPFPCSLRPRPWYSPILAPKPLITRTLPSRSWRTAHVVCTPQLGPHSRSQCAQEQLRPVALHRHYFCYPPPRCTHTSLPGIPCAARLASTFS